MDSRFLARIFGEVALPAALWPEVLTRYGVRYSMALAKNRYVPGYWTTFLEELRDRGDVVALCEMVGSQRSWAVKYLLGAGVNDEFVLSFILTAYILGDADLFCMVALIDPWCSTAEELVHRLADSQAKRILTLRRAGCPTAKMGSLGQYVETEDAKRTRARRSRYDYMSPFTRPLVRRVAELSGEETLSAIVECEQGLDMLGSLMTNQLGNGSDEESLRQWLVTFSLGSSDPDVALSGLMRSAKALVRGEQSYLAGAF